LVRGPAPRVMGRGTGGRGRGRCGHPARIGLRTYDMRRPPKRPMACWRAYGLHRHAGPRAARGGWVGLGARRGRPEARSRRAYLRKGEVDWESPIQPKSRTNSTRRGREEEPPVAPYRAASGPRPTPQPHHKRLQNERNPLGEAGFAQAADGTRTHDLLHGNRLRDPHKRLLLRDSTESDYRRLPRLRRCLVPQRSPASNCLAGQSSPSRECRRSASSRVED
jgi:hypothetical protein